LQRIASDIDTARYYRAAVLGLRYLEARKPTGRRFGPDADARWASFRGDLTTADRIDLLIRDANAQWPAAFGARTTFAARAVAEDEPFGPGWTSLDPVDAEELWRAIATAPPAADLRALLSAAAAAWELATSAFDPGPIGAAEKLTVAGPSAIAATIVAFGAGRDLDWSDQVTVIATPPAHRQLAALGGALLGVTRPTTILATTATATTVRRGRLLLSPDADPADAQRARETAA
jgi:hypothetical protein